MKDFLGLKYILLILFGLTSLAFAKEDPLIYHNHYSPAVTAFNGWMDGAIGVWHSDSRYLSNGKFIFGEAGASLPLMHRFGLEADINGGRVADGESLIADAYLFWRDPHQGLAGFHYEYADVNRKRNVYTNLYGVRGEAYFGHGSFTIEGGSMHTNRWGDDVYGIVQGAWYIWQKWLVNVNYTNSGGNYTAAVGSEYQLNGIPGLSVFGSGGGGNHDTWFGYVGFRLYFGCDKTLERRHREDIVVPLNQVIALTERHRFSACGCGE